MKRLILAATAAALIVSTGGAAFAQDVTKYVRYDFDGQVSYGILDGDFIHQLRGDIYTSAEKTGAVVALGAVRLLVPVEPRKVVAAGFNYRSHLGDQNVAPEPGLFDKHATSLVPHEATVTYYEDATNLHFEGEMVLVIGKRARNVTEEDAADYIFAVAPGERHQRAGVAGERPAVVPGEGSRHVRPRRSGHGARRRLQRPAAADPRERRGVAVAADRGPHLRPRVPRQLHQPLRHPGAGAT